MRSVGNLRKYAIDNRVDKEGAPDPRLIVTIEFKFSEAAVRSLAALTDGSQVSVEIDEFQPSLFSKHGSPLDDPQSGAHGDISDAEVDPVFAPPQLPWDGVIADEDAIGDDD